MAQEKTNEPRYAPGSEEEKYHKTHSPYAPIRCGCGEAIMEVNRKIAPCSGCGLVIPGGVDKEEFCRLLNSRCPDDRKEKADET